ncbi:thioredoxin [Chloropicon primus]|uniref:Thioredoxin n=2 Tax=Chloropicon primus TaxID=1764295 RepID=A0A5B8MG97_9CHLO|nr:thioredoxin [Chloropicon primus]UPQ98648.1 thioredoxin [Chloropicon primus]|eukprot:QDZ19439.1 thioredoxin [Chloropicon primus]
MMRKRLAIAQERDQQHPPGAAGVEGQEDQDNVVEIQSIRHLIDELERAEDKLVVVSFHATWCAACRKVQPLVQDEVKGREDVVLLKVRYDTNKQICKTLGVRKLPYFHFYRGSEGKLEDFSASAKTFHRIKEAIAQHGTPRCTLGENHIVPDELQELVGRPQDPK